MTNVAQEPDATPAQAVILVAEDEVLVRMLIADLVQEAGFRVIEAANALEALRVLEARPDVHVLVTGGLDCVRRRDRPAGGSGRSCSRGA